MKQFLPSFIYAAFNSMGANMQEHTAILPEGWIHRAGEQLMWLLLAVVILQLLFWLRNRLRRGPYSDEEVEQADPLFLAYLRSKGRIKLRDTLASLFALTRLVRTPILLRLLVGLVFPLLWLLTGALCLTDGSSIGEGISLGASLLMWLLALRRIRVRWPFHIAGVGLLIAITLAEPSDSRGSAALILAIMFTLLVRLLLPVREMAPSARDWADSMNRWRRRYKKGNPADRLQEPAETLERILLTALVLRIGSPCARKTDWNKLQDHVDLELRRLVQQNSEKTDVPADSSLLHAPLLQLTLHLRNDYRPLLAAEYPYERLNYISGSLESGSYGRGRDLGGGVD